MCPIDRRKGLAQVLDVDAEHGFDQRGVDAVEDVDAFRQSGRGRRQVVGLDGAHGSAQQAQEKGGGQTGAVLAGGAVKQQRLAVRVEHGFQQGPVLRGVVQCQGHIQGFHVGCRFVRRFDFACQQLLHVARRVRGIDRQADPADVPVFRQPVRAPELALFVDAEVHYGPQVQFGNPTQVGVGQAAQRIRTVDGAEPDPGPVGDAMAAEVAQVERSLKR